MIEARGGAWGNMPQNFVLDLSFLDMRKSALRVPSSAPNFDLKWFRLSARRRSPRRYTRRDQPTYPLFPRRKSDNGLSCQLAALKCFPNGSYRGAAAASG